MTNIIKREQYDAATNIHDEEGDMYLVVKAIMRGYESVLAKSPVPPSLDEIEDETISEMDKSAYDILHGDYIYKIVNKELIMDILNEGKHIYVFMPGHIVNNAQQLLINNLYDEVSVDV